MTILALVVAVLGLVFLFHGLRGVVFADRWQAQVGEGLLAVVGILVFVAGMLPLVGVV